jgi:hypothetical protein
MLERLHGVSNRPHRARRLLAWHGRFATSPASAEPGLLRPPLSEPPTPAVTRQPASARAVQAPAATPATVDALSLDRFVAPAPVIEPEPAVEPEPAATAVAPPPVARTRRPVVAHEELDPEVRALVDELYEQARAELAGFDGAELEAPVIDAPGAHEPAGGNDAPPAAKSGWHPAFVADERKRRHPDD